MERSSILSINGRQLDLVSGELHYRGDTLVLEAKVLAVFKLLYSCNGNLVSQQTLLTQVWHDSIVAPNAVQRCIAQLRKQLGDDDKTLVQTFPKKGYRLQLEPDEAKLPVTFKQKLCWRLSLLFAVMATGYAGYLWTPAVKQYDVTIQPLTYGINHAQQGVLVDDALYYIERTALQASVIRKDLRTEHSESLYSAADFYGVPALSPDGQQLTVVALQVKPDLQKCTALERISLRGGAIDTLSACAPAFIRQIHWIADDTLLAVSEQQLYLFNVAAESFTKLNLPVAAQQLVGSYWQGGELYLMGLDPHTQPVLWRLSYQPGSVQLHLLQQTALSYTPQFPAFFSVNAEGILLQQHANTLYIYRDLKLQQTIAMANANPLQFTFAVGSGQSVASQGYVDYQVLLSDQSTGYLAATPFAEQDAQFQPGTAQIAFLSNRSGHHELWLQSGSRVSRLPSRQAIDSFVWQQDGKALWTLDAGQLYRQPLDTAAQPVMAAASLRLLLQHVRIAETDLLLALDKEAHLWLIDVAAQTQQKLFDDAVHWAQVSDDGQIFVATPDAPTIKRLVQGQLHSIAALQHSVLQWRFYWRNNQLLFADKQQQILAYSPTAEALQALGQYSADFAMATDLQAAPLRILANTTHEAQSMQVLVKLSLRQ